MRAIVEEIVAEVRQLRVASPNSAIVLVEGARDTRVLQQFVRPEVFTVDCDGIDRVVAAGDQLAERNVPGVLAITDADDQVFRHPRARASRIMPECRDLEGLLIGSPALRTILIELRSVAILPEDAQAFRNRLYEAALPLGALRVVSGRDRLRLKFRDGVDEEALEQSVDHRTLASDVEKVVRAVCARNRCLKTEHDLVLKVRQILNAKPKPEKICNGHDLVRVLAMSTRPGGACGATSEYRNSRVESSLRLAFHRSDFVRTAVGQGLEKAELAMPEFKILIRELS